jgi:hypothetical protein
MPRTHHLSSRDMDQTIPFPGSDTRKSDALYSDDTVRPVDPLPIAADAIQRVIDALTDTDRLIVHTLWVQRLSLRQASRAINIPLGSIVRRKRLLAKRICNPVVLQLLKAPDAQPPFDPLAREVALRSLLNGESRRHIASDLKLTRRAVNQRIAFAEGWASHAAAPSAKQSKHHRAFPNPQD